mmetsp:Transcript_13525/g.34408  ORF Transcript_13525/g.34408 Transcript_13525/m.34408 type:complete len:244 (-) Transcript_13525:307-1038(-)
MTTVCIPERSGRRRVSTARKAVCMERTLNSRAAAVSSASEAVPASVSSRSSSRPKSWESAVAESGAGVIGKVTEYRRGPLAAESVPVRVAESGSASPVNSANATKRSPRAMRGRMEGAARRGAIITPSFCHLRLASEMAGPKARRTWRMTFSSRCSPAAANSATPRPTRAMPETSSDEQSFPMPRVKKRRRPLLTARATTRKTSSEFHTSPSVSRITSSLIIAFLPRPSVAIRPSISTISVPP